MKIEIHIQLPIISSKITFKLKVRKIWIWRTLL